MPSSSRSPRLSLTAADVARQLEARPQGDGQWSARCPAHDDKTASLSVGTGDDGRVLLHCHAGCPLADVCRALGVPQSALFPPRADDDRQPQVARTRDWGRAARDLAADLDDEARLALAAELGLPAEALDAVLHLGRGSDKDGDYFSLPEFGSTEDGVAVVGVCRRYRGSGRKKALPGSKRGLALPLGWLGHEGPVLVPEGWSDALALAHAGLAAVGRPSARGGAELLAALLGEGAGDPAGAVPPPGGPRPIVILAENDRKEDGSWPGRVGALAVAQALADALGRPVGIAFPLDGFKDARAWLTAQVAPDAGRDAWRQAGRSFLAHVEQTVQWLEPDDRPPERRVVVVDPTDVAGTADVLAGLLYAAPDVYALGGKLARVRRLARFDEANVLSVARQAEALEPVTAADALSRSATFRRPKGDDFVPCRPPEVALAALLARDHVEGVRHLRGVASTPLLLPDGRLVSTPGFDAETGWFVDPGDLRLPPLPERPTRDDAVAAAARLLAVVEEFPWRGPADRAAWLAYLLALCCRASFAGCVPLFAFSAPTPGSGKSLLARLAALIALGREPGMTALPIVRGWQDAEVDEAELRKLLYAVALTGGPLLVFDNVPTCVALGGAALDLALTSGVVRGRTLGQSEERELPWRGVVVATGNNLQVQADTTRRVVYARLEPDEERPAERGGFRILDLPGHVRRHRGELLAAAITVVRAYLLAGKPEQGLGHYGSFEGWSDTVRGAVHWATGQDPLAARADMPTSDAADEAAELLGALAEVPNIARGLTCREILATVRAAQGAGRLEGLRGLLAGWCRAGEDLPTERSLGMRLRGLRDRVAGGRRLRFRTGRTGTGVWLLEEVRPPRDVGRVFQRQPGGAGSGDSAGTISGRRGENERHDAALEEGEA